ncbi:MAG: ferric reductase-like transmembrane domain-containing protein [Candidatus Nomurabacteria bacterium]|nr:MAG: ferric reductase-like transmembrane domain-containing protein [Candidatus Nomurabacteria bacterium]
MRKSILALFFALAVLFGLFADVQPAAIAASTDNSIKVQTIPGPTLAERMLERAKSSWPWYIIRASGIVAAVALLILILSGIGQVTGYTYRFLEPLTAWASHRALGIAFGVSVSIHMFGLLFDHFVPFNIWQILIPWLSDYKVVTLFGLHLGSLYVAMGTLAFYLTMIIIITSLLWVEKKPIIWKWVHLLSYVVILFVFVHALYLGTDLADGLLRILWVGMGAAIAVSILYRLWRAKTI